MKVELRDTSPGKTELGEYIDILHREIVETGTNSSSTRMKSLLNKIEDLIPRVTICTREIQVDMGMTPSSVNLEPDCYEVTVKCQDKIYLFKTGEVSLLEEIPESEESNGT